MHYHAFGNTFDCYIPPPPHPPNPSTPVPGGKVTCKFSPEIFHSFFLTVWFFSPFFSFFIQLASLSPASFPFRPFIVCFSAFPPFALWSSSSVLWDLRFFMQLSGVDLLGQWCEHWLILFLILRGFMLFSCCRQPHFHPSRLYWNWYHISRRKMAWAQGGWLG